MTYFPSCTWYSKGVVKDEFVKHAEPCCHAVSNNMWTASFVYVSSLYCIIKLQVCLWNVPYYNYCCHTHKCIWIIFARKYSFYSLVMQHRPGWLYVVFNNNQDNEMCTQWRTGWCDPRAKWSWSENWHSNLLYFYYIVVSGFFSIFAKFSAVYWSFTVLQVRGIYMLPDNI